jgi:hypothetical protein
MQIALTKHNSRFIACILHIEERDMPQREIQAALYRDNGLP